MTKTSAAQRLQDVVRRLKEFGIDPKLLPDCGPKRPMGEQEPMPPVRNEIRGD